MENPFEKKGGLRPKDNLIPNVTLGTGTNHTDSPNRGDGKEEVNLESECRQGKFPNRFKGQFLKDQQNLLEIS